MTGRVTDGGPKQPADCDAAIEAAVALQRAGRTAAAEAAYRRILDRVPGHAGVLHNLAVIAAEDGRREEALALFDRALAVLPDHAGAHLNRGGILQELGRFDGALASYDRAIALAPEFAEAHARRGHVLRLLGRHDEAARACRDALARNPDHYEARFCLGLAETALGAPNEALKQFDRTAAHRRAAALHQQPWRISRAKLAHDRAQLLHLASLGIEPERFRLLAQRLENISQEVGGETAENTPIVLSEEHQQQIAEIYGRLFHVAEAPALRGSALDPALDVGAVTAAFAATSPGVTVIDSLLSDAALASLRCFLQQSTIWFDFTHIPGFLAAYLEDGLACPIVLQIADGLRQRLPGIFHGLPLTQAWAFKCLSGDRGIDVHADAAAISVNFWVTPDSANLDPGQGGLVVYRTPPPAGWKLGSYDDDIGRIRTLLADHHADRLIIPYRANRAVIFESTLFHESGPVRFRPGYLNHRINITMLFGDAAAPTS